MGRLRKFCRSAVLAYCLVAIGFVVGIVHVQQIETRSCHSSEKSWDAATAIIAAQTTPSRSVTPNTDLAAQIAATNIRRSHQRTMLTRQLGKRPAC